jgi:hypothetical protein
LGDFGDSWRHDLLLEALGIPPSAPESKIRSMIINKYRFKAF